MSGLLTGQHGAPESPGWTPPHSTAGGNQWQSFLNSPGMQAAGQMNPRLGMLRGMSNFAQNPSLANAAGITPQTNMLYQVGQGLGGAFGGGAQMGAGAVPGIAGTGAGAGVAAPSSSFLSSLGPGTAAGGGVAATAGGTEAGGGILSYLASLFA